MAVIKATNSHVGISRVIDYVTKEEKTEEKFVSGINCEPETAKEEMQATKILWNKTGGRTCMHFVHSYHANEKITPEQAHENALELARNTSAWHGHEVLVATHIDRGHIHSHIVINSVNFENGRKLQFSKADLQEIKDRCNEQSRAQGLAVPEKGKTFEDARREETVANKMSTYQLLKKAERGEVKSYVQDIALAVMDCREVAKNRQEFIQKMQEKGYAVKWEDNRKYITFVDLARQQAGEKQYKIRNNKLDMYYNLDLTKEGLENEFASNSRKYEKSGNERATDKGKPEIESTITSGTRSINAAYTGNDESAALARAVTERKERADRVVERREREAIEARREREEAVRRKREAEARERAAAEKRKQQRQENQRTRSRDRDFER